MIDQFSIFHRGGAVLWERTLTSLPSSPVDALISQVLLEERAASSVYRHERYICRWTFANDWELIFVAVYLGLTPLLYIDDLLDAVKADFTHHLTRLLGATGGKGWAGVGGLSRLPVAVEFDARFDRIVQGYEMEHMRGRQMKGPRTFEEAKKGGGGGAKAGKKTRETKGGDDDDDDADEQADADAAQPDTAAGGGGGEGGEGEKAAVEEGSAAVVREGGEVPKGLNVEKLRQMQALAMRGGPRPMRSGPPSKKKKDGAASPATAEAADDGKRKRVKAATKW